MEEQQPAVFSFNIDDTAQSHLTVIARWNRFMAIVGIVVCFLIIISLVFGGAYIFSNLLKYPTGSSSYPSMYSSSFTGSSFAALIFVYVVLTGIYLVPCFFRLGFANKMLSAIANTDQELLNDSLKQLKIYSQYWGILTIIMIGFYSLLFIVLIIAFLVGGMR